MNYTLLQRISKPLFPSTCKTVFRLSMGIKKILHSETKILPMALTENNFNTSLFNFDDKAAPISFAATEPNRDKEVCTKAKDIPR